MDQIFESHFGGGGSGNNGTEIDAYCSKCRADTRHVILESYGNDIRRVQCGVCNDIHAYKKPRGPEPEPAEPAPPAEAGRAVHRRARLSRPRWPRQAGTPGVPSF